MDKELTIGFVNELRFLDSSIRDLRGTIGLYFIYLLSTRIPYPLKPSRLVYVGMSESRQNSIGNRLRDHVSGQSGNLGLTNFIASKEGRFTFHSLDFLEVAGVTDVWELEYVFLTDFARSFGSHPMCNNQSGIAPDKPLETYALPSQPKEKNRLTVDWSFFN